MKLRQVLAVMATVGAMTSCAIMSTPEGGPKDETPPTLVSSNPRDQQLNVKTNTITLVFDEEVMPNNLTRELLITPNVENKYTVKLKKEQMTLQFERPFVDSTTYTFNFRKGIQDITEKNPASALKLSFSTGSYIDSSRVSGTVVNLLSQTPEKEAVVALYPTNDTLSVRKNRPYYQTQTDATGKFKLENIKEGEYRIYAIVEKNNNSFYDNEDERIAYLNNPIYIKADSQTVTLRTIKIDTKPPLLLQRENYTDRFVANYNEEIKSFTAKPADNPNDTLAFKIRPEGKAVELFKTTNFTGGKTIISAVDSAGNSRSDTLQINFQGKRAQRIKGAQLKVINSGSGSGYVPGQIVTIELETPVRIAGKEPISILADSAVLRTVKYPEEIILDKTATELSFTLPNLNGRQKQLNLALDSAAIVPLEGEKLSFPTLNLNILESKGTGTVRGTVNSAYTNFTIQLLDKNMKLVQEQRNTKSFIFRNLQPEIYRIRVLIDENNDGVWYAGDPKLEKEPEKVYMHPEEIQVRANWDLEALKLEF